MSYNQQHFNPYQQGQQYIAPYQKAGQINQNQQFYNNHVNQQQQHDDFGDFVSSSSQNNPNQQNTKAQNKYDAFNYLQGPSGFIFNESPQKPLQKQGQNQMFMNNQAPNNFNVQVQNQQNLAAIQANSSYGYGNIVNQNANSQNLHQLHNQQQYQMYQQQQLQQQQFQQSQIYQHQAQHMNQNQALHQQYQQNQLQNLQSPQQINQFYAQNQVQMAQAALNNPQYQAQLNLSAQQQQRQNFGDDFGDFSTASTVQNANQVPGSFNSNGQTVQQNMNQYQLHQNFQSQGYSNQGQNFQQNLVNMNQSTQSFQEKHSQISHGFNTAQHSNLQAQNHHHNHMNQQQLNWRLTQNHSQQIQKESDDFGDFNDAPSTQNNSNAPAQFQNQFQSMPQIPISQNFNNLQQAQAVQPQLVPNQVQQINKLADNDDDFGDFTSHQSYVQTTTGLHNLSSNNLSALNIQGHQQNSATPNLQQQQPKIVKQDSDEFGDFTTVQTINQQPLNGIQSVISNTQQVLSQSLQPNTNMQVLQNAFGNLQVIQQDKDNNKKQSDDFGDFEMASGTNQKNSSNQAQNEKAIHNQFQNSAQKSDGFGEFTDAQPQAATFFSSFNQTQQSSLPTVNHNIQNHAPQQKISDDFGDFQDINASSTQQQNQSNQQNVQQEGFQKYNVFYQLEQKAQESQPKVSVLDMPLDMMVNQQQKNENHQKNQDLFGDDNNQNEDGFGDFQDIKTENLIQQQTQQEQIFHQQIQNQNARFHSDQSYNNNFQPQFNVQQANILFNSQLPTVKKSGAEIEKELIGNVISLFDDYKVDHLTDKNKLFQNQNTQQIQQQSASLAQPQSSAQIKNKAEDDEFGDFEDFQESKQQEKAVAQPIHAYELDWDSIIKQNQQVDNDLQPQDQLQDELSQQGQQESKLNANKKNHQNDLFEDHSSQNNAKATSSIQDNNQADHTSSQTDTLTLDFERNLKAKKNQKKNDFEDDLQAEIGGDDDFGDFETSNKNQQVINIPQNNYPIFQAQATNNNVNNNNDDLFEDFEQAAYQPQQQNNQVQNSMQKISNQQNDLNDNDLFGDFQDNGSINQQKESQQQNYHQNDEFDEFEDFAEAPTQQNQQGQGQGQHQQIQQQVPKQEVKIMDLKEFEMNTFDITALDYGEGAKQKVEQQKREQERKKLEEEEKKRLQILELEQQKQQKLNQIPQFKVGKQIYKGEYWRKVYESDERFYVDNKFYEDLIQEIDSLGLYLHFEKLISIREGLDKVEGLEQQRKKAKNEQSYDKMYQLKQEIDQIESQKDYKAEMMSLVYQVIACEGKCFNHLIYDRIRNLENAIIFVKQFQTLHDQNRDVDEVIDFMIITTTIDNNYSSYIHKLYQVQEVCQKDLQQFESKMKQFHSLPTQAKQQIIYKKEFTDFIKASTQILYHGKRYSKISASLSSQSIDFDILEKIITNNILIINKQFNTNFEQIKKNFSFTEELTQEQREKLINDIVNRESNLHLNEFICNLCLGVANDTRVHYRGKHYHNLCINIWFNKISTIIE